VDRKKYLLKNTGILTISNFASKILVFLLVPLYTSVLSTSEYGTYDLIISSVGILLPVLTCNISDAVIRYSLEDTYPKEDVISIGMRITLWGMLITCAFVLIIKATGIWQNINGLEIFTIAYVVTHSINQFLFQTARGCEKVFDIGVAGVISTVVMIAANIIFLLVLQYGLEGFFLATILGQIFPTVYLAIRLRIWRYLKRIFNGFRSIKLRMITYSAPLVVVTLSWWVNSTSDRFIVAAICGVGANGLLSVAYKIPAIINTVQGIFIQAWQLSAIKEYSSSDKAEFYGKTFSTLNTIMVIACSILIILTKPIATLMFANDFYNAWQYVPLLLLSCVINSASGFLGPILAAKEDSKSAALSALYGAIANIIMNIGLVFLIGIQGACIATVIASFIIFLFRKRSLSNEIIVEHYGMVLFTWAIICAQAVLEIYFKFWYLEIILIVIILVINRNEISNIYCISRNITGNLKNRLFDKRTGEDN